MRSMKSVLHSHRPWSLLARVGKMPAKNVGFVLASVVALFGLIITREAQAAPVTHWMNIFHLSDFKTFDAVGDYLLNLRVPIPPVFSLLEIASYRILGTVTPVTIGFYRAAMVGAFVFAILLASSSLPKVWASFVLSVVLLSCTALIHPGNPVLYDVMLPFLLLGAILALEGLSHVEGSPARALAGGILLGLAELTRPFAIVLIVPILIFGLRRLRGSSKKHLVLFVLPILALSGTWHLVQLCRHGQVLWTNHSGFNMSNAWPMVERPDLMREETLYEVKPGRWPNLNNRDHGTNSVILQRAIVRYIIDHPTESLEHILNRVFYLATGPTRIYSHAPEHWLLAIYPFLTHLLILDGVLFAFVLGLFALESPAQMLQVLDSPQNVIILITAMSTLIYAAGEAGEEARFLVSMLPFLACVPLPVRKVHDANPGRIFALIPVILWLAGCLLVSLSLSIDVLRGRGFSIGLRQLTLAISGMLLILLGIREAQEGQTTRSLPKETIHE